MALLFTVLRLIFADPVEASALGATLGGHPELAEELVSICARESPGSRCVTTGLHRGDSWAAPLMHKKALQAGHLRSWCPWHQDPHEVGVRGPHGLSYAYTVPALPFACFPPSWLEHPLVSAWAWTRRADQQCKERNACTPMARRRLAAGAANFDRRMARFLEHCAEYGGVVSYSVKSNRLHCEAAPLWQLRGA